MNLELTDHVLHRIEKRKLSKEEIEEAIKYPDKTIKKHGLYYFQKSYRKEKLRSSVRGQNGL